MHMTCMRHQPTHAIQHTWLYSRENAVDPPDPPPMPPIPPAAPAFGGGRPDLSCSAKFEPANVALVPEPRFVTWRAGWRE